MAATRIPYKRWTEAELATLRTHYPMLTADEMAKLLPGRSAINLTHKANRLGLEKTREFYAMLYQRKVQRGFDIRKISNKYRSGHPPWNKGKKGWSAPGSEKSRFTKGAVAPNRYPVGSYRINKQNSHLERKISNAAGSERGRWQAVHRLVWQEAHGPIPKGHVVTFKPGRKTTVLGLITLDALDCISRAEHVQRNSLWALSHEVGMLSIIKAQINKQVNRIAREAESKP